MQGTKVTSISKTGIKETGIIVSTEFDEQKMIGDYLSYLDNMIALETLKHEKLSIIRKAMLEQLFPEQGCSVPKVRLKIFFTLEKI